MEQIPPYPQTELRLRIDVVLDELQRLHDACAAGRAPTPAELCGLADDLRVLGETVSFASAIAAFDAPAFSPVA